LPDTKQLLQLGKVARETCHTKRFNKKHQTAQSLFTQRTVTMIAAKWRQTKYMFKPLFLLWVALLLNIQNHGRNDTPVFSTKQRPQELPAWDRGNAQ